MEYFGNYTSEPSSLSPIGYYMQAWSIGGMRVTRQSFVDGCMAKSDIHNIVKWLAQEVKIKNS